MANEHFGYRYAGQTTTLLRRNEMCRTLSSCSAAAAEVIDWGGDGWPVRSRRAAPAGGRGPETRLRQTALLTRDSGTISQSPIAAGRCFLTQPRSSRSSRPSLSITMLASRLAAAVVWRYSAAARRVTDQQVPNPHFLRQLFEDVENGGCAPPVPLAGALPVAGNAPGV